MIYRSEKLLRQDIFFACVLNYLALNGIQGKILPQEEIDKFEDTDPKKNLFFYMNELVKVNELPLTDDTVAGMLCKYTDYHCLAYLRQFMPDREVVPKLGKLARQAVELSCEVFKEFFKGRVDSHKFILVIYDIITELNHNQGVEIPAFYEELFKPFLMIEGLQDENTIRNSVLTDDDWTKMKKSAEKQAKKYVEVLKSKGYFVS